MGMIDLMASFAEILRRLRKQAGLTQEGLARSAALSVGTIRDYEQGKKEPSLRSAFKLAGALGVGIEAFQPDEPRRKKGRK
jgi:transcriptional regulator with XRE-family HTH domain